jgi:PTS system N-acetylglucosamine-specific IIC component
MIDEPALKALGARGIVRPGGDALQVVLGPIADQVADELRSAATANGGDRHVGLAAQIANALRAASIRSVELCGSRLVVVVEDASKLSVKVLDSLPVRGWVAIEGGIQIIIGPDAAEIQRAVLREARVPLQDDSLRLRH